MAVELLADFENKIIRDMFNGMQKNISAAVQGRRDYALALGSLVMKDVLQHFTDEAGPKHAWKSWSDTYTDHMNKIGKGGNKILQYTGRLRNNLRPGQYSNTPDGLEWYNNAKTSSGFPYAYAHDEGGPKLPKRNFMWASDKLMENVSRITLAFALRGKI